MNGFDFSGVWRCCYFFPSNQQPGETEPSEYRVAAYQRGNKLVFESLPNESDSYMLVRLTVDGILVSGSWQENTSPSGEFKGMIYSGVVQLIFDPETKRMVGKWAGVGHENGIPDIYTGEWTIEYLGEAEPGKQTATVAKDTL